jgi:hypothetical protein
MLVDLDALILVITQAQEAGAGVLAALVVLPLQELAATVVYLITAQLLVQA